MSNLQTLIETKLPEDLQSLAIKFTIPEDYFEKDLELIVMILRSRSIDTDEEKQNWFNLLTMMNDEQVTKLKGILIKEKTKLEEIEKKYEKKKQEIKEKYLNKWEDEWYISKVEEIKDKEEQFEKKDEEEAEELLSSL